MNQYYTLKTRYFLPILLLSIVVLLSHPVLSDEHKKIKTHDPRSKIAINYNNITLLLQATVTRPRMSSRIYAQKRPSSVGTKVNLSNKNPTRMEASRTFYHYIRDEELEHIHNLRLALEALPSAIPFQTLNRDEQLAYWLNLYNITVYEQVAKHYPIRKLKKLFKGSRKKPSLWDEKILNVNNVPLSLNDIQYNIIQKTWPDPIVLYGLYKGMIGSPNLRRKAYTGKLVYEQLEDNAEEFVNSLRGLRFKRKDALVSEMYDRNRDLFPDFDADLRRHLRKYANLRLVTKLDSSKKIKTNIYDWHIADVLNGSRSAPGGAGSTNPVAMAFSMGGESAVEGMTSSSPGGGGGGSFPRAGSIHSDKAIDTATLRMRLPNEAAFFLKEFVERNRKFKDGTVTVDELSKKELEKIKQRQKSEEKDDKDKE